MLDIVRWYLSSWHLKPPVLPSANFLFNSSCMACVSSIWFGYSVKGGQETLQSDFGWSVSLQMGVWQCRDGNNLLRRWASLAPPTNFIFLFCEQEKELDHECVTSSEKQVFGQFCCFYHGRGGTPSPFELRFELVLKTADLEVVVVSSVANMDPICCLIPFAVCCWLVDAKVPPMQSFSYSLVLPLSCISMSFKPFERAVAGEVYKITFPAYYVRGILIGVMRMEIR